MFTVELERALIASGAPALHANMIVRTVVNAHSEASRHYHGLAHLEHLCSELAPLRDRLQDPDAVLLAIAFHDFCYQVRSSSNERRSARKAREILGLSGIHAGVIHRCEQHILATAHHGVSADEDTNCFTDADLSVLGASPEVYDRYAEDVRKEYSIYPDLLYRPGRRKVLEHFLAMERIFKTAWFHGLYEERARVNLRREADRLR